MPDSQARAADAERTRGQLVTQNGEFLAVWQQLDGYIEEANPTPTAYKAMRDAAGHGYYDDALHYDWAATERLLTAALNFGTQYEQELKTTGEMPDEFLPMLRAEAEDVRVLLRRFTQEKSEAQEGTTAQQTALLVLFEGYQKMSRDGQRIFRTQPETARLFQTEHLLSLVRGTGQAGVRGTLTLAGGAAAGVLVQATGKEGFAVSAGDGRYALNLAAGTYTLALSGEGYTRQEVPGVVTEAGVKKRLDAVVARVA